MGHIYTELASYPKLRLILELSHKRGKAKISIPQKIPPRATLLSDLCPRLAKI